MGTYELSILLMTACAHKHAQMINRLENRHAMLHKNTGLNDEHIIKISLKQQRETVDSGDSITKEESKLVRDFTEESMRSTAGEGFEAVCGAWLVKGRTPMGTR